MANEQEARDDEIVETLEEISTVSGRLAKRLAAFKDKHRKGGRHGAGKHARKRDRRHRS